MSALATTLAPVPVQARPRALPAFATNACVCLGLGKLGLHALTSLQRYGYFRDELYYLDLGRHLGWGYVDCAPLVALYARVAIALGGSLTAVRLVPALAGVALVALAMALAREMGGGRYAQILAGMTVGLCPGLVSMESYLSMNAFEPVYWMAAALAWCRILRTGRENLWPWFGLWVGLGLENKLSTVFFGCAVALALLLTPARGSFRQRWVWLAGAVAVALFLPNLIWQLAHHWPSLVDLENVRREGKNIVLSPLAFAEEQMVDMNPFYLALWVGGLITLRWRPRWRPLGFTFAIFFALMEMEHGKSYYVFPIYPLLFAAGAVALARGLENGATYKRTAMAVALALAALPTLPLCTDVLNPPQLLAYERAIRLLPRETEVHHEGTLPQSVGDQFGWPELVRQVADLYHGLPAEEQAATAIVTGNYGEAGAINWFGPALGLPRAYSPHQHYWYLGPPPGRPQNLILLQWDEATVARSCDSYRAVPHFDANGMAEEDKAIYYCRGARLDVSAAWPQLRHWN